MTEGTRILVFHDDPAFGGPLLAYLAAEGFNAVDANTPLEVAWALAGGEAQLLVVHVCDVAWIAAALLTELRSVYPTMPVVVVATPTTSTDSRQLLGRFENTRVLRTCEGLGAITDAIHEMLPSSSHVCNGDGA